MLRILTQTIKITVILGMVVTIALGGRWFYDFSLDRTANPGIGRPVKITIAEDEDTAAVADMLADKGLIRSELYFKARVQIAGVTIEPGEYTLRIGMSTSAILDAISTDGSAEVAERSEVRELKFQATEGWRLEQIASSVAAVARREQLTGLTSREFLDAAAEIENSEYPELLDSRSEGHGLEGYLFPATYTFPSNAHVKDIIYYMLDTMDAEFTPDMRARAADMGLTIHQVLTLASIVEREAAVEAERPVIAALYLNRLTANPPMTLDADPTVAYVLGSREEWWPVLEPGQPRSAEADNPYNTYLYSGLPPGPICSPGLASISAVLYPDDQAIANGYLFMVAKNDGSGSHAFATTLDEHQHNINLYQN